MKSNLVRLATFSGALVLASATASAAGVFAGQSGWQSPAEGGNGDYVFIDAPAAGTTAAGTVTVSGRAGNSSTDPNGGSGGGGGENTFAQQPQVVIAMIDTGGNPYHVDFRDDTRLFHPSTYLTGFPANATAVPLCFVDSSNGAFTYNDDCSSAWETNVAADEPITGSIAVDELVWYPGTRLMGKSFAHEDASTPVGFDEGDGSGTSHGSWVSSTAVGNKFGTCPECMLIILEADTVDGIDAAYQWAAEQPWIDVITSSITVGVIGAGVNPGLFTGKHDGAVAASANGKIFLTSSGNGAANLGLVPTSTFLYDGGSPAVIPVGASSDAGFASHWSDYPAEIMANGNSRQVADTASMTGQTSVGGTSFSSPGAAGVLAHSLLAARRACNDFEEGASPSGAALTLLRNRGCAVASGPFADGTLTRDELHEAFVKNAIPPYDQLSPIPGPVTWAKNAYGYVDLGHGINNGGSTIQPLVTDSILGNRAIPVRALEQFWYDDVVREAQSQFWGPRPTVDGDDDAFPRDDGACMPDCAPAELQRYAEGFAGLGNSNSTYQDLFDVLGVSADDFAQAPPTAFGGTYEPTPNVAGVIAETGELVVSNDESFLTVRLNLAGVLDGFVPTVRSNPISYEVLFKANHNGVAQDYRLSYEFQGIDLLALLGGTVNEPLVDKFTVAVDTAPNEQGTSWICPIDTDLSGSHFDVDANSAVWVIPLTAFDQSNRPAEATASCGFTRSGRALAAGDTIADLTASAVLTVGIVNFGNGLGLFGESTADDYTLGGGVTPPATVAVTVNGQPAGTVTPVGGQWSLDVDLSQHAPVDGTYVIQSSFGTATDAVTLLAGSGELSVTLAAQCGASACDEATTYEVSEASPLSVTFTASARGGSGDGRAYTFYFGDGTQSQAQDGATIQHEYARANPGGYHARVVVTEDNASNSATSADTVIKTRTTVTVDPEPVATEAALTVDPASGAVPVTVTADASGTRHATGTASSDYAFDFDDGTTVSGDDATATHVYTHAGTYTVKVTVTDRDADGESIGEPSSATRMVAVGTGNQLTALLAVSPSTVQVGEIVTFDGCHSFAADGRHIIRYTFDPDGADGPGEPVSQNVNKPVSCEADHNDASVYRFAYETPGQYRPTLSVTDDQNQTRLVASSAKVTPAKPAQAGKSGAGAMGWAWVLTMLGVGMARRRRVREGAH